MATTQCFQYSRLSFHWSQVIDFGSSCYEHQRVYTYIQSRFYRAPEVILGAKYGTPIDMWSLGCILAELLTGYALFPGEDENDQLACIIELLGMPPQKLLDQSKRTKNFITTKGLPRYCTTQTLEDGNIILGSGQSRQGKERGPPGSKNLKKVLKGCDDPLFLNFLCGCLEWDPEARMTPKMALNHTWFRRRLPRPPPTLNASTTQLATQQQQQPNTTSTGNAAITDDLAGTISQQINISRINCINEDKAKCSENIYKPKIAHENNKGWNKPTQCDLTNSNNMNALNLDEKIKAFDMINTSAVGTDMSNARTAHAIVDSTALAAFQTHQLRADAKSLSISQLLTSNNINHFDADNPLSNGKNPSCSFQSDPLSTYQKQNNNTLNAADEKNAHACNNSSRMNEITNNTNNLLNEQKNP